MKEKIPTNIPNPETSSIREENLNLLPTEWTEQYDIYRDKDSGELFHKIKNDPRKQKFISLLLKGTINVADIVTYHGGYYSHEQNIKNIIDRDPEFIKTDTEADLFILKHMFGDKDHSKYNYIIKGEEEAPDYWRESSNVMTNRSNTKKYIFDFNAATLKGSDENQLLDEIKEYKKQNPNNAEEVLSLVNKKCDLILKNNLNKEQLESFKAIIKKSGFFGDRFPFTAKDDPRPSTEEEIEKLFYIFIERFKLLYNITKETNETH
jgi:hypothetical protein